jgi:hypothetical protein
MGGHGAARGVWARARVRATLAAGGLAALLVLLAPAAGAESFSRCRAMSRQIAHFHNVGAMAKSRGDGLWQAGTQRHIARLEIRQKRLCPNYLANIEISKTKKAIRETKEFMKKAALAAARYFAFGF